MYLKSLEISGFKSFVKKTGLEFSTPITGIVGPNGSGKSNVAEAFRFVLGEQSIKSMRGKKGEDLIFNGSTQVARANRASVKVVLDNTKKVFPIDFDEVSVERTVHRDGTNEYAINGSRTRLRDVQELLAAANIGPTGHHIISQGEADRILSATARERREMIEDALGLKVYQYKKVESERKLAKTQENIAHVESLRKEVQPHLRFLERQVKKIEKSLELREKLQVFYKEYLKREDVYITYSRTALATAKEGPEKELTSLEEELTRAREILEREKGDEKRDALVALEKKIREGRDVRQEISRESGKVEGQITLLERTIQERIRKAESIEQPVPFEEVRKAVGSVEQLIAEKKDVTDAQSLRSLLDDVLSQLRTFLGSVSHATADTKYDAGMESELEALKKAQSEGEKKLAVCDGEEAKLRNEYDEMKRSIEAEQSQSRTAEREVFRIMGRQQELQREVGDIERKLHDIERDASELEREIAEAIALIGRDVAAYETYAVLDENENAITAEAMQGENREKQLDRRRELEKMKIRLEELGGGSSDEIMKEYKEVKERDEFLEREVTDLHSSVASLESLIEDLAQQLNEQFNQGIKKIDHEFNHFFALMFGGGTATLKLVTPKPRRKKDEDLELNEGDVEDEPIEEGVDIDVTLPHKRIKGLEMLSGGERALTSIALIFAMSQVNPPLFVILDETDAALDEANSRRYGDMIESLAKKSQLILITHNRETMSRAGVLYGVTMSGDGVSKLLSVKFEEAVAVAK